MMRGGIEETVSVVVEEKDKKKNKRRPRRSKQISSVLLNDIAGNSQQSICNDGKGKNCTSSMNCTSLRKPELDEQASQEVGMDTASSVAFNSMPTMHLNERAEQLLPSGHSGYIFSKSCPEPVAARAYENSRKGLLPFNQIDGNNQIKIFDPYWSMESAFKALEKGDAFKCLFRVNAHNRLEAYCKVEGVPVDILINGVAAQNRSVEGDTVVIKVDPLSLWTKMKGTNGPSNSNNSPSEDCDSGANGTSDDGTKGKSKVVADYEYAESEHVMLPQQRFQDENGSCSSESRQGPNDFPHRNQGMASDSLNVMSSSQQNHIADSMGRLCALISSHPSKRPTGRVVAIIEKSPRRDSVVGFLNLKHWFSYRACCKKDSVKDKVPVSAFEHEYIELTPTDPKFPKLMVLVKDLPDITKKRLENVDVTVEMDLVAARIDKWSDDCSVPHGQVSHIFGRGSDLDSQISAILYQNAICCSDFSPESLSCLPCKTWKVPPNELQTRRDLRNLCIFTIDTSTASDLDDALSVERLPNGNFSVGVHIADVSYFVLPDTALDVEAQIRSTSVYMLQRKLSMLPPLVSENLGSLNPGVDRLAFSILWELDGTGNVMDRWIGRTVIHSCCKLSYEHAQYIIDEVTDDESCKSLGNELPELHGHFEWSDVAKSVKNLHEISIILRDQRINDGAIRLESSKIVFLLDESGVPYDSMFSERKDSNFLVEEFTLLANRTAAEVISRAFPDSALLRRHPEPNMRKLKEFEAFCAKHGLKLDTTSSGNFHCSLERIRERLKDDRALFDILINYAARPMQLANYFCSGDLKDNTDDWRHYALAVPLYTHFTSPLRRYPDIVVHRTLAAALEAEELYGSRFRKGEVATRCFTGIYFDKDAAESTEGREALSAAALKHGVRAELLTDVAAYCNDRKLASRHVKDACDKLYMWVLLKKKEVLLSQARVLGLGPRFMSIYIHKLGIERRIYYDDVEGLAVEWLETTSTLVLSMYYKRSTKRAGSGYLRPLDDVALVVNPCNLNMESCSAGSSAWNAGHGLDALSDPEIEPLVFPSTIRVLSTIPVALYACGGDDGPPDVGARLFMSSYYNLIA